MRRPLYVRLLALRHVHPTGWQRALLGEGSVAAAVLLALSDAVSAWVLLAFPLAVAAVVKAHDVLAGLLQTATAPSPTGAAPSSRARARGPAD